jgi:predicted cupin superfamily sugar epimerase
LLRCRRTLTVAMEIYFFLRHARAAAWDRARDRRQRTELRFFLRGASLACVILIAAGDVHAQRRPFLLAQMETPQIASLPTFGYKFKLVCSLVGEPGRNDLGGGLWAQSLMLSLSGASTLSTGR